MRRVPNQMKARPRRDFCTLTCVNCRALRLRMYDPSANKPVTRQSSRLPERPTFLASNVFDGVMPGSADTYKTSFWDSALQA